MYNGVSNLLCFVTIIWKTKSQDVRGRSSPSGSGGAIVLHRQLCCQRHNCTFLTLATTTTYFDLWNILSETLPRLSLLYE